MASSAKLTQIQTTCLTRMTMLSSVFASSLFPGLSAKAEPQVFKLTPKPVYQSIALRSEPELRRRLMRGAWIGCREEPLPQVKAYPRLLCPKPLYGMIDLDTERPPADTPGKHTYAYVLDSTDRRRPLYNRLTIDLNQDLDLSNDRTRLPVRRLQRDALLPEFTILWQTYFEPIHIPFACGEDMEKSLSVIPRVVVYQYAVVLFLATEYLNQGLIQIGNQSFQVILGHCFNVPGWFDQPICGLYLISPHRPALSSWIEANQLKTWPRIKGTFYGFSATPLGDRLTVHPYQGSLGTIQVGAGYRTISKMSLHGSLVSEDRIVAVGDNYDCANLKPAPSSQVPVGDYRPGRLQVEYGTLRIDLRQNPHSDGKLDDRKGRAPVYGIKIRENRAFTLDFSNTPQVMFASPALEQTVHPGEKLEIKAFLTDPHLDMLVRNLETVVDTVQTNRSRPRGKKRNPKIRILSTDGRKIAEGVMPFG